MKPIDLNKYQLNRYAHACPVCGMDTSETDCPKIAYNGQTYSFCTEHCQKVFEQAPDIYLHMQIARIYERSMELELVCKETLNCLSRAAEYKDNETAMHTERIGAYSYRLAKLAKLDLQHAVHIREAAPMHDIGKIGILESILLKPGKLNKDERKIIEQHPQIGVKILGKSLHSDTMKMASLIALSHHERWDGSGYPFGLREESIPVEGRIVALCDVFDALISERPYKSAWPTEKVHALIISEQRKHFDPKLAQLFVHHFSEFVEIHDRLQDIESKTQ